MSHFKKSRIKILGYILGLSIYSLCISAYAQKQNESQNPPNIVFILADDLGYSDVGYMKQRKDILTPNIDALAQQGMVFTNAYASCPVCSPTRASLITGKYPATLKITCHIPGAGMETYISKLNKGQKLKEAFFLDHLPTEEVTIAEALKTKGYATGFIGKWHLAGEGSIYTKDGIVNAAYHPDKQGFDVNIGGCAYGQPKSYFSPYGNGTIKDGPIGEYLTDRLGEEAIKFIENNKDHPFFLDFSTYAVHTPLQVPEEELKKINGNKYFALISKLDQNVGKVISKLKELDLIKNTIVIFYSDNGGVWGNPPLRGDKGSLYEGGIRVPLIVSWPEYYQPGSTCDTAVSTVDFFPTLLELANISSKNYPQLEGKSLIPLLEQKKNFPERDLYWHFPHHRENTPLCMSAAIRSGDWKLIEEFETKNIYLFNLKKDVAEQNNLSATYPEKAKMLLEKLHKWQNKVGAEMPQPNI
ncbi:sulfatase [Flavobacterium algicola]|uniref:sulfatase n=1 Tax=Flavobacterium algicola TaxID=556529 RepID=UPI001EFD6486|nr:sulfatase [Flavobacterium algicola]MCG9792347.1 sulfatase [Flavobacterium algicola]